MKIVVDMNLTLAWCAIFRVYGWDVVHWSEVGDARASDLAIMQWAMENGCIVFTHDLDFGTLLALTGDTGPSVIQVRTQNVLPSHLEKIVVQTLQQYETELESGALISIDELRSRIRILPIQNADK